MLQTTPVKDLRAFQSVTQEIDVTVDKQRKATPVASCNTVTVENRTRGVSEEKKKSFFLPVDDDEPAQEVLPWR